jgi:regulator of sigma E protease
MFLIDLIIFFLILGVVVLVHEFGHFIAAKQSGVLVEEFGIGFPPKIWKKKIGETEYFLGAIPLGGMVKVHGMDTEEGDEDDIRGYDSKNMWQKLWICGAGIVMNILFASALFYILIGSSGFSFNQNVIFSEYEFPFGEQINYPLISYIKEGTPADESELKIGDYVVAINAEKISSFDDFKKIITENEGREIVLETGLGDVVKVTPRTEYPSDEGSLGVGLREISVVNYTSAIEKSLVGFLHSYNIIDFSFSSIGNIFSYAFKNNDPGMIANSMAGPVGIFAITKITLDQGLYELINLIAVLSVAIGITNLLPIPVMDGAKMIYIVLQNFNKRIFTKKLQTKIEYFGFLFLIFLALAIIIKDFVQFKDIIFK